MSLEKLLTTAKHAAVTAAAHIKQVQQSRVDIAVFEKAPNDIVTELDHQAEQDIIKIIREHYPDHAILSEETGEMAGKDICWIIDPIDGTTNLAHGFPHYAISIAAKRDTQTLVGVVYDIPRDECFTAVRGQGAWLNEQRLQVSRHPSLKGALLATGFPSKQPHHLDVYLQCFATLFPYTVGIRRAGSAALDLAYVAAGRLDGFWEFTLKEWDIAAGALLVEEAGGHVCDLYGEQDYPQRGVMAGNPKVLAAMIDEIAPICRQDFSQLMA